MEFHNYYMQETFFHLVEFHDIDTFVFLVYNNLGIPRLEVAMVITFVGHRMMHIDAALTERITNTIKNAIQNQTFVFFYCGGYGDFDNLCAQICRSIKSTFSHCELVYVTPYITPSQQEKIKYLMDTKLYDSIIYPPLETVPLRLAIIKRNEWMVSAAELIIAYVAHTHGGAYKTLQYARKKKKTIINLAQV